MHFGSKGTCTFKTDNNPTGNLHPFAGQIFYSNIDDVVPGAPIHYSLRTGGKYAVVTMGDSDRPISAVAVAYNAGILSKKFDEGDVNWTIMMAQPMPSGTPRALRIPPFTAGEY
ncbi:unnamed protein product [Rhizoctonia solani]|uniref:Uncharacterized protein n=1 Tax=Rhizoctonia solani TaxID=456999 RepID=A0A8H3GYY0_9AGAM|nr:unnamed protein product [Rhizoctonia solani]